MVMDRDAATIEGSSPPEPGTSTVTVVLRLLSRHLERGELVGHGEVVATGAVADIRDSTDVIRLAGGASQESSAIK
jgi:hypothetical protein